MTDGKSHKIVFTRDGIKGVFEELFAETDRAVAILAASYLDALLEGLLRAKMVNHNAVDNLFDADRALGSFSAKTHAAFSLGCISESEYRDLTLIRRIRNEFAHKLHRLSFESHPIADWCRSLTLPDRYFSADRFTHVDPTNRHRLMVSFAHNSQEIRTRAELYEQHRPVVLPELEIL